MQDRPTASELLDAVQHFLETEVVPALDGPKRFHARVAANIVAILRRELETADCHELAEWRRLASLLGEHEGPPADREQRRRRLAEWTEQLCVRIRRGEADAGPWRQEVLSHVRHTVVEKLAVANPRYLEATAGAAAPDTGGPSDHGSG